MGGLLSVFSGEKKSKVDIFLDFESNCLNLSFTSILPLLLPFAFYNIV